MKGDVGCLISGATPEVYFQEAGACVRVLLILPVVELAAQKLAAVQTRDQAGLLRVPLASSAPCRNSTVGNPSGVEIEGQEYAYREEHVFHYLW